MDARVFLFLPFRSDAGNRLKGIIETLVPDEKIEIFPTGNSLVKKLKQPSSVAGPFIAVLLAERVSVLNEVISFGDLLSDFPMILILPDRDPESIAKGHRLRPRFMSYGDSDFVDVAAVLSKMLENDYLERKIIRTEKTKSLKVSSGSNF